uniref:Uncharacterized protein n=1 Tax=Anguilla anguilla TaxID=7936 RepID=A0A0E9V7H8_ANGAN
MNRYKIFTIFSKNNVQLHHIIIYKYGLH